MGVFVINPHPGLIRIGNIDLTARPFVKNADGSTSTVRSVSFSITYKGLKAEVLVPSVIGTGRNARVVSDDQAWREFEKTKSHLGIFTTPEFATAYAKRLHFWQIWYYRTRFPVVPHRPI